MEKLLIISSDADALGAWRQGNDPMNLPSKVGKGAILVISTDAEVRGTCRQALEGENVSVLSAAAITDAMGTAKGRTVDVVLVDAEILGDRAGEDIFEKFREENPDSACIFLAKPSTLDRALQASRTGAYDVYPLPVIPNLLGLRVSRALEKKTNLRELKRLQALVADVSLLWGVAKGELDTSEIFDKDFLAPAALRLTVAHEFRAPITAMQSFLLILLKGYVSADKWKEMIQHALDRSQDLLNLVDDLMNLAAARQEISISGRTLLPLGEELEKVIPTLQAQAEGKGIVTTVTIHRNPAVEVFPIHMGQVWTNLISNAIKYTPPGGKIQVILDQGDAWAIGTVADTGIGIGADELPLIFNNFFRTAEARRMEPRGTGLGLTLVKRIVEGYGGKVEAESFPGKGSLFRFKLPLAPAYQKESGAA
jgi:signal transduction histidine kinase